MKAKRIACQGAYLTATGAALLSSGCGDRSVSGSYVSHNANSATLLQITEIPDHHFTGTFRRAVLNNDGNMTTSTSNVSGSVDSSTVVLAILDAPFRVGQNISGTVTGSGLDLTVPATQSAQTATAHFDKADTSDDDSAVAQLTQTGAPVLIGGMNVDKATISNTNDAIARAQKQDADREAALNVSFSRLNGLCLSDRAAVKIGDVIPDQGLCEGLSRAVDTYHAVLPPLHSALANALQAKAHGNEQLATIWRATDNIQ